MGGDGRRWGEMGGDGMRWEERQQALAAPSHATTAHLTTRIQNRRPVANVKTVTDEVDGVA